MEILVPGKSISRREKNQENDFRSRGGGVLRFRMGTDVRPGIPTTTL